MNHLNKKQILRKPRYTRANTPLLWVVIPMMIGIIYAQSAINPEWWWSGAEREFALVWQLFPWLLMAGAVGYGVVRHRVGEPLVFLTLVACGAVLDLAQRPEPSTLIEGERLRIVGRLTETPIESGRWQRATTLVTHRYDSSGGWRAVTPYKTQLYIDTSQRVALGSTIDFRARSYPIDSSYGRYMGRRRVYSRSYTWRVVTLGVDTTLTERVALVRESLSDKLAQYSDCDRGVTLWDSTSNAMADRITDGDDATAVMQALALGYRADMSRELRSQYSRVGVAHILAVSGMHVGIIFVMLNLLLGWIRLLRGGRVWLGVVVIVVLMLYAVVTGLAPSVLRAVVMFSLLQIGIMLSRPSTMLNTLCAAAIGLLLWNPLWLYDIGFQLSFIAMVGIATLYGPIVGLLRPSSTVLSWLWSITVVALAAQICTLPLATHYFGVVPLAGLLLNPIVWFTVPLVMVGSLLYLAVGWGWIWSATHGVASVQNMVVGYSSSIGWVAIDGVTLWAGATVLIYILLLALIVVLNGNFFRRRASQSDIKKLF